MTDQLIYRADRAIIEAYRLRLERQRLKDEQAERRGRLELVRVAETFERQIRQAIESMPIEDVRELLSEMESVLTRRPALKLVQSGHERSE